VAEIAPLLPLLPSVEKLLASLEAAPLCTRFPRTVVVAAVRAELEALRAGILAGGTVERHLLAAASILAAAASRIDAEAGPRLQRVVNATGVVLHTNLGRARLSEAAAARALEAARYPCALEYDVTSGARGHRDEAVERHLTALTGAEAATVVNNNAAAVLLLLDTLAAGREVVVSRGELVEIGGSFRVPEIMKKGGAVLREVGTTNRTHVDDYDRAVTPQTAMFLKVHTSNYHIVGFTSAVGLRELRGLADRHPGVIVAEDLGSGALVDLEPYGLGHEPLVAERLSEGADLVTFSGDKLLGGPQCGIVAGRRDLIERMRRNPLVRALRCDKMTLASLEETLREYRYEAATAVVPTLRALTRPVAEIERVGREAVAMLQAALGDEYAIELVASAAQAGAGARPDLAIESRALAVTSASHSASEIAVRFRRAKPPIVGRVEKERFLLDLRTIDDPSDVVPKPA
jgi:L-seryl-tRNA(Ser) seleniumtransferase